VGGDRPGLRRPAVGLVLAVTTDTSVVYTSNVFALPGMRALYFLLAGAAALFRHLQPGAGRHLAAVAVKLLIANVYTFPTWASPVVIAVVLAAVAVLSIATPAAPHAEQDSQGPPMARSLGPRRHQTEELSRPETAAAAAWKQWSALVRVADHDRVACLATSSHQTPTCRQPPPECGLRLRRSRPLGSAGPTPTSCRFLRRSTCRSALLVIGATMICGSRQAIVNGLSPVASSARHAGQWPMFSTRPSCGLRQTATMVGFGAGGRAGRRAQARSGRQMARRSAADGGGDIIRTPPEGSDNIAGPGRRARHHLHHCFRPADDLRPGPVWTVLAAAGAGP